MAEDTISTIITTAAARAATGEATVPSTATTKAGRRTHAPRLRATQQPSCHSNSRRPAWPLLLRGWRHGDHWMDSPSLMALGAGDTDGVARTPRQHTLYCQPNRIWDGGPIVLQGCKSAGLQPMNMQDTILSTYRIWGGDPMVRQLLARRTPDYKPAGLYTVKPIGLQRWTYRTIDYRPAGLYSTYTVNLKE